MIWLPGSLSKEVDQAGLEAWAELSGDFNPLHVDPAFARGTRYGRTIIHGHLSLTWLMEWAGRFQGADWVTGGRLAELRFRQPLHPGVTYRVEGREEPDRPGTARVEILLPDGTPAVSALASGPSARADGPPA